MPGSMSDIAICRPVIPADYNPAVVRRTKTEALLRSFEGSGTLRERGHTNWFPVEFLMYQDYRRRPSEMVLMAHVDPSSVGAIIRSVAPWKLMRSFVVSQEPW